MTGACIEAGEGGRLYLRGEVTFNTVPDVWERACRLFDDSAEMIVDLGDVERADSAGLALLVEWMRAAKRRDTAIRFLNMPAQMLAIARVSSLDQILPLGRD
ncbi:MAG: STAS domain-containing protein [Gammaproteobacteria bacterium]